MSDVYIRTLVYYPTGHVVWAAIETNPKQVHAKRIPTICPELDYRIYKGPMPAPKEYRADLIGYRLIKNKWSPEFQTGVLPPEFANIVTLMRAKCYASNAIHGTVRYYLEKHGIYENPLLNPRLDTTVLSEIYSTQHKLSIGDAKKLIEFKRNELLSLQRDFDYAQIRAELAIANSTTVDQVVATYQDVQHSWGKVNAFDITKVL